MFACGVGYRRTALYEMFICMVLIAFIVFGLQNDFLFIYFICGAKYVKHACGSFSIIIKTEVIYTIISK